ncbi:caspase, EACC1-associated type [Streptosporangium sp. G11]|uniref:caspase, EACC1-associated type n=1 Tax=Streptosporangium sp. G11 TaxID=3436926 RepID=UPI003EBBC77D
MAEDATLLSGSGVRVLVAGSGTYEPGSKLPEVGAVASTVADLGRCLTEQAGLPPENLRSLVDPAGPREFADALRALAEEATDVAVLHYVGHGLVDTENRLHLATHATADLVPQVASFQTLPYDAVRDILAQCRAPLVLVVLDCCYAGRADVRAGQVVDVLAGRQGHFVMAAVGHDVVAWAPPGDRHTTFTGELIRLLTEGEKRAPRRLGVDDVFGWLARRMRERALPVPERKVAGHLDTRPVMINPAYPAVRSGSPLPPPAEDGHASPYPGLAPFSAADADLFFGRSKLRAILLGRVENLGTGEMIMVTGPSGSGKSSLLNAGLAAALQGGSRTITPGADPLGRLDAVRRVLRPDQVLIVDQFEELFTVCESERDRTVFVSALAGLRVVIALRGDHFDRCAPYPELVPAMGHPVIVAPMTDEDLREAITEPAARAGLAVAEGLADRIVREIGQVTSGTGLPLLATALLSTWTHRENRTLTLAGYEASGGIVGALTKTAGETIDGLGSEGAEIARGLIVSLVRVEEFRAHRRPVPLAGLLPAGPGPRRRVLEHLVAARLVVINEGMVELIHDALINDWDLLKKWISESREELVLRQNLEGAASDWEKGHRPPDHLYEGARLHDAVDWGRRNRDQLSATASAFLAASTRRSRRRLVRLALAGAVVLAMLLVAVLSWRGEVVQREAAGQRALLFSAEEQRQVRAGLSLRLGAAAYALDAGQPEARAGLVRSLAENRYAGSITDPEFPVFTTYHPRSPGVIATAAGATVTFWDVSDPAAPARLGSAPDPSPDAGSHMGGVSAVAMSADGRLLALGHWFGWLTLWDIRDLRAPRRIHLSQPHGSHPTRYANVRSAVFGPGGRWLATGSWDHRVIIWDLSDEPRQIASYEAAGPVHALPLSPDGALLAVATNRATRLLDVRDPADIVPRAPLGTATGDTWAAAFAPRGRLLAVGREDAGAVLWDVTNPDRPVEVSTLKGHTSAVRGVTFTPDGRTMLSAADDGTAVMWDVSEPAEPVRLDRLTGHARGLTGVAVDAAGTRIATGSLDRTTVIWDLRPAARPVAHGPFGPSPTANTGINAFSGDGRIGLGGRQDANGVTVWDTSEPLAPVRLSSFVLSSGVLGAPAVSHDGRRALIGVNSGNAPTTAAYVWNLDDPRDPVLLGTLFTGQPVYSLELSPDGRVAVTTNQYGHDIILWQVGENPRQLARIPREYNREAAFSPDGTLLALAGFAGQVELWDVGDPAAPQRRAVLPQRHTGEVYDVVFSPDGALLVTASDDGTAGLWRITVPSDPVWLASMEQHTSSVYTAAFSRTAPLVATAGFDETTILWDITIPESPRQITVLTGHGLPVSPVEFHPGGDALLTQDNTSRTVLWDIAELVRVIRDPLAAACAIGGGPSPAEWRRYGGDTPPLDPCA